MSSDTSISTDKLSRLIGITNAPALVGARIDGDFAAGPRLIPGATRRSRLDVQDWALQRFPFIRETPQIPQLTHVLVGEPVSTSPGHALGFAGQSIIVICHTGDKLSEGTAAWLPAALNKKVGANE
jgi:hypothetical protein